MHQFHTDRVKESALSVLKSADPQRQHGNFAA